MNHLTDARRFPASEMATHGKPAKSSWSSLRYGLLVFVMSAFCQNSLQAQSPITFDKVVELLQLEVKEEKLLNLLKAQPTVFTLSEAQIAQLKSLGATETLLASMTGKSTGVVESDTMAYAIILDVSGSMTETASNGLSKWDVAKASAIELINSIPSGLQVAFIVYGHDKNRPCEVDVLRALSPVSQGDKAQIISQINQLVPVGKTPIAKSLSVAANQLNSCRGLAKTLLITDGLETCEGNPVAEAKSFADSAPSGRSVDVIGFALTNEDSASVSKIAMSGKGKFIDAKTSTELASAFDQVKKEMLQKLTTTEGAVPSTASKDPAAPTELKVGTYTKARLAPDASHYWKVDFPAGKFVLVYDVKCANDASQVIGSASLGTYDGNEFVSEKTAGVSENEIRARGVATVEFAEPTTKLIRVINGPWMSNIEDYHVGVFSQDANFGIPFLTDSPEIKTLAVGQATTSPLLGGAKKFYLDCDVFFKVKVPAGDFKLDVKWESDSTTDQFGCIRGVAAFDLYGASKRNLAGGERNQTTSVVLQTADEQEMLLRVRAAATNEKVTVSIHPVTE